jgi:hypothetical protein
MTRTLALAVALAFTAAPTFSQSTEPSGLEKMQNGFVVAPDFKFSELDGRSANLLGGYGGWLTDRKLFIGAGAYWLTSGPSGAGLTYGGGLVEWFAQRNERFNVSFRGLVGAGSGTLPVDLGDFPESAFPDHRGRGGRAPRIGQRFPPSIKTARVEEGFFVAEPQAMASFTLARWMRIAAGGGYRLIAGASGLESRFRGPTASISLQIGSI